MKFAVPCRRILRMTEIEYNIKQETVKDNELHDATKTSHKPIDFILKNRDISPKNLET